LRKQAGEKALAPERGYKVAPRLVGSVERGDHRARQHVIEARPERRPIDATRSASWRRTVGDVVR
jgi:hypothetical protein